MLPSLFKAFRKIYYAIVPYYSSVFCKCYLFLNGVKSGSVKSWGVPYIYVLRSGMMTIGNNVSMNNRIERCESGVLCKCRFRVLENAELRIGNSVGMSGVTISCRKKIIIEDHVMIGVGAHIYDSDFHSLEACYRLDSELDRMHAVQKDVRIKKHAFIGAHSIILKGVVVGENSIVGAGSVVTHCIPDNEIWSGNPARFIRKLNMSMKDC